MPKLSRLIRRDLRRSIRAQEGGGGGGGEQGRGERNFYLVEKKNIILSDGLQASPFRPPGRNTMEKMVNIKTLEW
jgi:hypothetical protein